MRMREIMTRIKQYPDWEDYEVIEIRANKKNGFLVAMENMLGDTIVINQWVDNQVNDAGEVVPPSPPAEKKKGLFQKKKKA